jgi:hypothetical protein
LPQQQQMLQHSGLAALVSGTSSAAVAAAGKPGGQLSNARRQLLQQIQEDAAGMSDLSAALPWQQDQQRQQMSAEEAYALAAAAAEAQAAAEGMDGMAAPASGNTSSSPGAQIMLGPNGRMVVLPQHVLRSAMSQCTAAMHMAAAPAAAPEAAAEGSAGEDVTVGAPRQTPGMLMTVTDDQGNVQYYFLPNNTADDAAEADAAAPASYEQQVQHEAGEGAAVGQAYATRSRAHKSAHHHSPVDDPMQLDTSPAAAAVGDGAQLQEQQQPRMTRRHFHQQPQQQQVSSAFTTPTKSYPPPSEAQDSAAAAAGGPEGRSLRSSSAAGGGSCRTTPFKRTTPIKRKADGEVGWGEEITTLPESCWT